jgi:hypothetical protein
MKNAICAVLACAVLAGCSTSGGMYRDGERDNGRFSPGRTFLTILGVAAGVAAVRKSGGGGGGFAEQGYAWDWQPGNGHWVCRNKANGEYAPEYQCAGVPKLDYWP